MNLCDIDTIRDVLRRHGFRFSRSLGQNFLTDASVPQRIAEQSGAAEIKNVVEIGPGMGCLTAELCRRAEKVVAVELDRALLPVLDETLAEFDNFEVVQGDVLSLDLAALCREKFGAAHAAACANLPYYITTPAITALLESRAFDRITVMVQKEVAQRICAAPGNRTYGAYTAKLALLGRVTGRFEVGPGNFMPPPHVNSAVVRIDRAPLVAPELVAPVSAVIDAAFAQRRKTIRNSMSASGFSRDALDAAFADAGIQPACRAETLAPADFVRLSDALSQAVSQ